MNEELEKYGTGFIRIRKWLEDESSDMQFVFGVDSGVFCVSLGLMELLDSPVTPPITITKLEMRILELLGKMPRAFSGDLASQLSIGRDTVKEYLRKLKAKGILIREGSARSGHWVVVSNE